MTVSFNFKLSNYIRTHTQSNVIKIITTLHLSSIHIRPLLSNTQVQIFFTRNFLKTLFGKNYKSISSIFVLSLISIYKEGNRQHLLQLFGYWRVKYECCKQKKGLEQTRQHNHQRVIAAYYMQLEQHISDLQKIKDKCNCMRTGQTNIVMSKNLIFILFYVSGQSTT